MPVLDPLPFLRCSSNVQINYLEYFLFLLLYTSNHYILEADIVLFTPLDYMYIITLVTGYFADYMMH